MGLKSKYVFACALFLICGLDTRVNAQSQSVQQSGPVTSGHAAGWVYNGIIQDGGPATNGNLSEVGITKNGGYGQCIQTTNNHAGPYSQICEGINSTGGYFALNGYGGAAPPTFTIYTNGVPYIFPTSSSVVHVGDGTPWAGDILAQIESAYTDFPASGGKIAINCRALGGSYDATSHVDVTTLNKYLILVSDCPAGASGTLGSWINFIPTTSGSYAFKIDNTSGTVSPSTPGNGFQNINLLNNGCATVSGGCGSSATGILVGTVNGGDNQFTYDRVSIRGFGIGYSELNTNNLVAGETWISPDFESNTIAFTIGNATEKFFSGTYAGNGKIFVAPSGTSQGELYFFGGTAYDNRTFPNFDYTAAGRAAELSLFGFHLEGSPGLGCTEYIQGNALLTMYGGVMEDSGSSGSCPWMIQLDNFDTIAVRDTLITSSRPYTQILDASNEITGTFQPFIGSSTNLPLLVGGANAGFINYCAVSGYGNVALGCNNLNPQLFQNTIHLYENTLSNVLVDHPCTSSAEAGNIVVVLDANSPTLGATVSGSGSTKVLARCSGSGGVYTVL